MGILPALIVSLALSAQPIKKTHRFRTQLGGARAFNLPTAASASVYSWRWAWTGITPAQECTAGALAAVAEPATTFTVTRGSSKYCEKSDGTLVLLGTNTATVEANGLRSDPGTTNVVARSEEFDQWTCTDATVTTNTHVSPDLSKTTADTITTTADGGYCEKTFANSFGARAAFGVYVRSVSGTQTVAAELREGTTVHCSGNVTTATTTWQRSKCRIASGGGSTTTGNVRVYPGGTAGSGSAVFWGAHADVALGSPAREVGPYVPTTTASAGRSADVVSFPTPTGWPVATGVVTVDFASSLSVPPPVGYIITATDGGSYGWRLGTTSTNGFIVLSQWNPAAGSATSSTNFFATPVSGVHKRIRFAWSGAASPTLTVDGVSAALGVSGWSTMTSSGATIWLGGNSAGNNAIGWIRRVCVSDNATGC